MNNKNIISILAILVTGIVIVVEKIVTNRKIEEIEDKLIYLGSEYNEINLRQERHSKISHEAISMIRDEICSVYEHIEELSNIQEEKDRADNNTEKEYGKTRKDNDVAESSDIPIDRR